MAVKYRVVDEEGHALGGPFYYIDAWNGSKWKWLAMIFAFFGICVGLFGIGTFSQVNGIASAVNNFFDPNQQHTVAIPGIGTYSWTVVIASLVLSICVALVLIGGIKRIANVSQIVVPFMAIIYVVISLTLIICNIHRDPGSNRNSSKRSIQSVSSYGWRSGNTVYRNAERCGKRNFL